MAALELLAGCGRLFSGTTPVEALERESLDIACERLERMFTANDKEIHVAALRNRSNWQSHPAPAD